MSTIGAGKSDLGNVPNKFLHFQLICTGQYYEGWLNDIKPIRSYHYITGSCFTLHLILSIPILIIKRRYKTKDEPIEIMKSNRTAINFGGLKTCWICMFPIAIQIILLSKLDKMTPQNLGIFPYYWIIYFIHSFNLLMIAFAMIIVFYLKSNVLCKAFKVVLLRAQVSPKIDPKVSLGETKIERF